MLAVIFPLTEGEPSIGIALQLYYNRFLWDCQPALGFCWGRVFTDLVQYDWEKLLEYLIYYLDEMLSNNHECTCDDDCDCGCDCNCNHE